MSDQMVFYGGSNKSGKNTQWLIDENIRLTSDLARLRELLGEVWKQWNSTDATEIDAVLLMSRIQSELKE